MRYGLETPIPLGKPTRCGWCGNALNTCRRIFKVKDHERYYCAEICFLQGEERRLRYLAALAGTVHVHWTVALASILAAFMLAFTFTGGSKAWAHDFYGSWQRADGKGSCCNAQVEKDGQVTGDCRPARAYPDEHGQWHVLIRGKYRPVPPEAIREYQTPDGNSHVCEDENNGIMCFVRGLPKS